MTVSLPDCRVLVVSCPRREPLQRIWKRCFETNWPDCPWPVTILSPDKDVGWNQNLITALRTIPESFILLLLDDYFIAESSEPYTNNIETVLALMGGHSNIALVKLQASYAADPDLKFNLWGRLKEYDRTHHPFKRTNLVPTLFRKDWLIRLSTNVLALCGAERDHGRSGANEFEVTGTLLTENVKQWPERMLGINRSVDRDYSLLHVIAGNGLREGYFGTDTAEVLDSMGIALTDCEAFVK